MSSVMCLLKLETGGGYFVGLDDHDRGVNETAMVHRVVGSQGSKNKTTCVK